MGYLNAINGPVMTQWNKAVFILFLLTLIGCSDETTIYRDSLQEDVRLENGEALLTSVNFTAAGVLEIYEEEENLSGKVPEQAGDYPLTLIASVSPPSYQNGDQLTASHVDVEGNFFFFKKEGNFFFPPTRWKSRYQSI